MRWVVLVLAACAPTTRPDSEPLGCPAIGTARRFTGQPQLAIAPHCYDYSASGDTGTGIWQESARYELAPRGFGPMYLSPDGLRHGDAFLSDDCERLYYSDDNRVAYVERSALR